MSKDKYVITRKIKLLPVGDKDEVDRVYDFIRDGQYSQYNALNILMGQLASKYYECKKDLSSAEFKEAQKSILSNSNPNLCDIEFAKGCDTKSAVVQKVKQDFSIAIKNGLPRGERNITNYKRTVPLITRGRDLVFIHGYENYTEFLDNLYTDRNLKVFIKWINKIQFKIVFGNPYKSAELRNVVQNIFEERYKVNGSSIKIDDGDIILNLSLTMPKEIKELDENKVVGVDLGLAIPAVCALNTNGYSRKSIGNANDFSRVRTKIKAQRRRLQKSLSQTSGGHGRGKKLRALNRFSEYEKHWVQNYSHYVSKQVVDFAIKNNAKYINLEDLEGYGDDEKNKFILSNWSYYQVQQYITYKAEKYGIEVRKINPYRTSQVCSCCGHWENGQRIDQATFICKNPECKNFGEKVNADFNAARNIALSTDWSDIDEKKNKKNKKK